MSSLATSPRAACLSELSTILPLAFIPSEAYNLPACGICSGACLCLDLGLGIWGLVRDPRGVEVACEGVWGLGVGVEVESVVYA